jgi:diacylglycerol kinase family enzyme
MNVFARELGIGSRRFDRALAAMKGSETQEVDIFTVNGKPFLQMAGFGPDARVIELITPLLKKRMGAAAHVVTGIKVVLEAPPMITMTLPDGEQLRGTQIIMGNGKRYGGEAHLFANARYDDGMLDAAIIHQESMPILFEILGCMLQRGATRSNVSQFTQLRTFESCTITAEGKVDYQLDGDYAGTLHPGESAVIRRMPHKLKVCIPRTPIPVTPFEQIMAHPMVAAWKSFIRRAKDF